MFLFQGAGGKSKNRKSKSATTTSVPSPSSPPTISTLTESGKKGGVLTTSSGTNGGILSRFSVRFNPEVYVMIFLLSVGFLFLFYHFYRYLREEKERWKLVSAEFQKQRLHLDNMSAELRRLQNDSKNLDDRWVEEIKNTIDHRLRLSNTSPNTDTPLSQTSYSFKEEDSLKVETEEPSRKQPVAAAASVTLGLTTSAVPFPVVMSEKDMDKVLESELFELEKTKAGVDKVDKVEKVEKKMSFVKSVGVDNGLDTSNTNNIDIEVGDEGRL
jgi:hypothetical protein